MLTCPTSFYRWQGEEVLGGGGDMATESEGTASSWSPTLLGSLLYGRPASTKLMVHAAHLPGGLAQPYPTATPSASPQGNPRSGM